MKVCLQVCYTMLKYLGQQCKELCNPNRSMAEFGFLETWLLWPISLKSFTECLPSGLTCCLTTSGFKSSSTSLYLYVHKNGCVPTKGLRAMPTLLMFCRRGLLHVTNHIGSPNMFSHTADIWNAYSLPVSLPHLLVFHPRMFQWPTRLLFLTKALGHCLHL